MQPEELKRFRKSVHVDKDCSTLALLVDSIFVCQEIVRPALGLCYKKSEIECRDKGILSLTGYAAMIHFQKNHKGK